MSDWYVGQKVVFVPGRQQSNSHHGEILPVAGEIYTILAIVPYAVFVGFLLEEIVNPPIDYGEWGVGECDFNERVFRPIVNQDADISVFERLLDPLKSREVVNA